MKKLFSLSAALCSVFLMVAMASAGESATVKGWISDSQCGAKNAHPGGEACARECLQKGAKMVVVTDKDQKILMVENPDALKAHIGHHVAVTGEINGDSIHVDKVKMM